MEESKVKLYTGGLNVWMDDMQQSLTKIRDGIALLEEEEGRLSEIWEGASKQDWETGLREETARVGQCIRDMEELVVMTMETAQELAQTERKLTAAAQSL